MIGRITNDPFVEVVKNGEAKALFAEVELSHDGEIRTVQLFPGAGAETWPCKGDVVVVERTGGLLYASAIWDGAEPQLQPGEREVYGRNADGEKVSRVVLLDTGEIQIESLEGGAKYIFSDKHFIGNNMANLCSVLLGIMDDIKGLQTSGGPPAHTVNPAYFPTIEARKMEIENLLTGEG